jgi:NADH dehydrogenase
MPTSYRFGTAAMKKRVPSRMHRVVIVGGGAGGLELATRLGRLRRKTAEIILVDRHPAHLWKPRLHEVAAGLISQDEDATGYLAHGRVHGFEFHLGEMIGINAQARAIRLGSVKSVEDGEEIIGERDLAYDSLVLAFGSRVNDFGVEGVLEHCHMLDSAVQAANLQRSFLEGVVRVAAGRLARLRVGIVGAGATGVELAAEFHHAVHAMEHFGSLGAAGQLEITLIDQAPRVLSAVDPRTSIQALKTLKRLGVHVVLGTGVQSVTADAFHLTNGETVACEIKIWASGVVGHDVVARLQGLSVSKGKRITVDDHLACVGVADIFAMGDCAAVPAGGGPRVLPPTAQIAHQQAAYLATALKRRITGNSVEPFRYVPRGTLISLGDREAAAELPAVRRNRPVVLAHGTIAKLLYVSLYHMHRVTLHGWLRAAALFIADRLRGTTLPPIKLH